MKFGTEIKLKVQLAREEFNEVAYEVRQGEILDELEVEAFLRERSTEMQATELVVKIKILDEGERCIVKKVEDEEQWSRFETFYISGPSGIGKSKFAKIWQENKY